MTKALTIVLSCILLSACGAKGSLTLPKEAPEPSQSKQDSNEAQPKSAQFKAIKAQQYLTRRLDAQMSE
ncbi:MAG: lipoprotein [Enterobacterales bacterium]|nr:lipoprotein [Enterobacterales bacterium]